jgi:hypothetical protein
MPSPSRNTGSLMIFLVIGQCILLVKLSIVAAVAETLLAVPPARDVPVCVLLVDKTEPLV